MDFNPPFQPFRSTPPLPRKRKFAEEPQDFGLSPPILAGSQPVQSDLQTPFSPQYFGSGTSHFALPQTYDRPTSHQSCYGQPIVQSPSFPYTPSSALQQLKVHSPKTTTYGAYLAIPQPSASPRLPTTPGISAPQTAQTLSHSFNPQLIRTPKDKPSTSSRAGSPNAKAEVKIQGNLMAMTQNWTSEEREARRRLVEFSRGQSGGIVTTTFKAVSLEGCTPNSVCVNCIYWEERDEYFITSVDTIKLLEALVAVRITIEEKNRVRRNLEAFKPLTVSKLNDTDSFFRLIMSFPKPKPRNVEKDVKIFPWSILEPALKKIFSKYSASYESTASHLLPNSSDTSAETTLEPNSAISSVRTGTINRGKFVIVGDSLVELSVYYPVTGLIPLARADFWQHHVMDRGFSGMNTDGALRILSDCLPNEGMKVLVIFLGANDSCLAHDVRHVPETEYGQNIWEMVNLSKVRAQNPTTILITPPPPRGKIQKKVYIENEMEDERIVRKEDVTAGYAQKIGAIAESLQQYMNIKVYVCDLFSAMMRETANRGDRSRFYEKNDDIHLNGDGYRFLYEELKKTMRRAGITAPGWQ